jgi:integrase/recombinase XerD
MQWFEARIQLLKEEAQIHKQVSLHTLRHSIATHLLQNGMDMEHIKKFLGHSSLESTQIYTHIINEFEKRHYRPNGYHNWCQYD